MVLLRLFLTVTVLSALTSAFDVFSDIGFEDPITNLLEVRDHLDNEPCHVNSPVAGTIQGVCRQYHQCNNFASGSDNRGNCPAWRVCCNPSGVKSKCGRTLRKRVSNLDSRDSGSRSSNVLDCAYTIEAANRYVCQMRIDFSTQMAQVIDGRCDTEYIRVEGGHYEDSRPSLCGKNENQHIFVHLDESLKIKIQTKISLETSKWQIKVTQLECPAGTGTAFALANHNWYDRWVQARRDSGLIAPPGCLQYFTGSDVTVYSLNSNMDQPLLSKTGIRHSYDMCFKRERYSKAVSIKLELNTPAISTAQPIILPGISLDLMKVVTLGKSCTMAPYVISYNAKELIEIRGFKITYKDLNKCV